MFRNLTNLERTYVLQAFVEMPWAILPSKLALLEEIVTRHVMGEKLDPEEIQALIQGFSPRPQNQRVNKVAVLPLFGTIVPRADMFTDFSGATSAERFGQQFSALMDDPDISAVVLDVDSPGGQSGGVEDLANKIFESRGKKPVVAVANHIMASAAYWIGTAADELVITPSGEVGSIGVFAVHRDMSAALEKQGVKVSLISEGKYKTVGHPYGPLSDEDRSIVQAKVSEVYDSFVEAVARNRGADRETVINDFGKGRMVSARQAVSLGMADRVGTLDETIDRLLNSNAQPAGTQANQTANGPQALSRAENVEAESLSEASEQTDVKPDPRKVQSLRKYLKVHVQPKIKEKQS